MTKKATTPKFVPYTTLEEIGLLDKYERYCNSCNSINMKGKSDGKRYFKVTKRHTANSSSSSTYCEHCLKALRDQIAEVFPFVATTKELSPFDDSDWDGFAGAESPSETQPPLIHYSMEAIVIVDKNGVEVLLDDDDVDSNKEQYAVYDKAMPFNQGKTFGALLINSTMPINADVLLSLGFKFIGH